MIFRLASQELVLKSVNLFDRILNEVTEADDMDAGAVVPMLSERMEATKLSLATPISASSTSVAAFHLIKQEQAESSKKGDAVVAHWSIRTEYTQCLRT